MTWLTTDGKIWKRRVRLTFTGMGAGLEVGDYPVYVELDSSKTDFWNVITNDRNDLRFTKNDGTTLLKHFIFDGTIGFDHTADDLRCIVEVEDIDAATDYVYLYWGLVDGAPASNEDENGVFTEEGDRLFYVFDQLSGHINDSTPFGNHTDSETGITYNQTGLVGKSLLFNGTTGYIHTPDVYCHGNFTVTVLCYPTDASADRTVLSLYQDNDNYLHIFTHNMDAGQARVYAKFGGETGVEKEFTVTNNAWNLICVEKEYDHIAVSVNGAAYSEEAIGAHFDGITFPHLSVGSWYSSAPANFFQGYVDFVQISYDDLDNDTMETHTDNFKEKDLWTWTTASLDGIPSSPTNLLCEGATNPVNVYDRTPELSAIFDDVNTSDTAGYYEIHVDNDITFASPIWNTGKQSMGSVNEGGRCDDISYAGADLTPNTTYYWRIRFWDAEDVQGEWSATATFLAPNSAPSAPTSLECEGATNPASVYDRTPEFTAIYNDADTADYAQYYQIQVDDDSGFGSVLWDSGLAAIDPLLAQGQRSAAVSYSGSALAPNTTYYWRIRFGDDDGVIGAWFAGTATFNCPNSAPSASTTLLCNGAVDPATLQDYTPYFSALYQDAEGGNGDTALYYEIELDNNADFSSTLWDTGKVALAASVEHNARCENIEYAGTTLARGVTYYWRIRFWDDDDVQGAWPAASGEIALINSAPSAPGSLLCEAESNPNYMTDSTPEFTAIGYDTDPADQMDFVHIQVDIDPDFGDPHWDSGKTAIAAFANGVRCAEVTYAGSALQDGQRYYWRILFWDDYGGGNAGTYSTVTAWFIYRTGTAPTTHVVDIKDAVSGEIAILTADSTDDPFVVNSVKLSALTMKLERIMGSDPETQYEDREFTIGFSIVDASDNNSPDDVLDAIGKIRRILSIAEGNEWSGVEQSVRLKIWPAFAEFPSYWPIKRGWITGYDPVDDILATSGEANDLVLHLRTTPWGRGTDIDQTWTLLRLKGGNSAVFTVNPIILRNHDDDTALHNNWVDVAPGDVKGDVPAMVELEIENHATAVDDIYRIHLANKDGPTSDDFVPMLIAEDGSVGTDTTLVDDATAPGTGGGGGIGRRAQCTFAGDETAVVRLTHTITAANVPAYRGMYRIYACAYGTAANLDMYIRLAISSGNTFDGESKDVPTYTSWPLVDMGLFHLPHEYISKFEDPPDITIAVVASRASGAGVLRIAYLLLCPVEWPDSYILGEAVTTTQQVNQSEYLMQVGQKERPRMFVEDSGRLYQHRFRAIGQNMYFRPGQKQRIFVHRGGYDGGDVRHTITELCTIRVRHNPRFSLSRS